MSVDFRQLQEQVSKMGELARAREIDRQATLDQAKRLISEYSEDQGRLRDKVDRAAKVDPFLRCARPLSDPLNAAYKAPKSSVQGVIIAADGSQIKPDRHAEIDFSLINVGAIQMRPGGPEPPTEYIISELLIEEGLFTTQGPLTEGMLALKRDLAERKVLLELSKEAPGEPVITFTDGPIELWSRPEQVNTIEFKNSFQEYLKVLTGLRDLGVATAGYVDRPGANHVVRLLEVGLTPDDRLPDLRSQTPLRGAADRILYADLLPPGCRSAVFGLQAQSAEKYQGDLQLHFFYLNVGFERSAKIARVEIPAWVAEDDQMLASLHSTLVDQSRILGSRAYPYLLHRAHEAAVVTRQDKDQITQMILLELRRRGLVIGDISEKQYVKNLGGRNRYS